MSTVGGGEVVLLPAAAVGAVAGAALLAAAGVAVAGGTVVYQAGKGVVACGRKIDGVIQAHAARQRAINQLCAEYEAQVRRGARQPARLTETAGAAGRAALLKRLHAYQELAREPEPEPPLPMPADAGLEEEPPPHVVANLADLDRAADQLIEQIAGLEGTLDALEGQAWAGLVTVDDLRQEVAELRQAAEDNRGTTESEPAWLLRDLRQELHSLRAEVAYRAAEGRARYDRRQRTAQTLVQAAAHLEDKATSLRHQPELQPALSVADDLLARADERFQAGHLAAAEENAKTALDYVDQLSASLDALRRSNLEVAIEALREYVEEFGFPPDDTTPIALNTLIAEAESQLQAGDFDDCWETITEAQAEADRLATRVSQQLETLQRDGAIELARETLIRMGYSAEPISIHADGTAEFRAERADGAYFRLWVTPEGLLRYKAENFGTAECQAETKRFFEKLKEHGMVVNTQSEFNLAATAERLREVLLRQGFDLIEEETTPDGKTRIITATKACAEPGRSGDGEAVRHTVDHESPAIEAGPAEEVPSERESDLDRARRAWQEAQRWHMQRMAERMRRRLRS